MLIECDRHTRADLDHWRMRERQDAVHCKLASMARKIDAAKRAIATFDAHHRGAYYVGASWGKDSVVVASIAYAAGVPAPLVYVRVEPMANPHCTLVRDAFLAAHAADYDEVRIDCERDEHGRFPSVGRLESGFAIAAERHGDAYVSGVRAEESGARRLRMGAHGVESLRTCAPIGWWRGEDVFAYLHAHELPVHPAYAMTMGGRLDRNRIRVATIGGERGTGHGRADWEARYYPRESAAILA